MIFKAIEITAINETLSRLADENLSLKTAITIAENLEAFNTSNTVIEKKRNDLIKKYAKKDENGNFVQAGEGQVQISNPEEFSERINEIYETEVEVEIKPFKMEELEGIKITPRQALTLKKLFITEE